MKIAQGNLILKLMKQKNLKPPFFRNQYLQNTTGKVIETRKIRVVERKVYSLLL